MLKAIECASANLLNAIMAVHVLFCLVQFLSLFVLAERTIKTEYSTVAYSWPETLEGDALWTDFQGLRAHRVPLQRLLQLSGATLASRKWPLMHLELQNNFCALGMLDLCVRHAVAGYVSYLRAADVSTAGIAAYNLALGLLDSPHALEVQAAVDRLLPELDVSPYPPLLGLSARQLLDVAIDLLKTHEKARPMLKLAQGLKVKVLVRDKRFTEAQTFAAEHLRLFPDDTLALNEVAISFVSQGQEDEARLWWLRSLQAATEAGNEGMAVVNFNNLMAKLTIEMIFPDSSVPHLAWDHLKAVTPYAEAYTRQALTAAAHYLRPGLQQQYPSTEYVPTVYGLLSLRKAMATGLHWRRYEELNSALLVLLSACVDARLQLARECTVPGTQTGQCINSTAVVADRCGGAAESTWHPYWFVHMDTSVYAWTHAHSTLLLGQTHRPRTVHTAGVVRRGVRRRSTPLRVGISSYDFREHAFGYIVEGWLLHVNTTRQRIDLLALEPPELRTGIPRQTKRLQALVGTRGGEFLLLPASEPASPLADSIATRAYDIMVDAMGPTFGQRQEITVQRPAPLIVLQNIPCSSVTSDAVTTDGVIMPAESHRAVLGSHAEGSGGPFIAPSWAEPRALYMPHTWFLSHFNEEDGCAARIRRCPVPARGLATLPVLRLGAFVQVDKMDPSVLIAWANVLRAQPHAVLILVGDRRALKFARLRAELSARGVHPSRLRYRPSLSQAAHIVSMSQSVDLMLDTWVCNGHTTTAEALWAGVPVLTLEGGHLHNRVSSSLLHASGPALAWLVTHSATGYEQAALQLVEAMPYLHVLRRRTAAASLQGSAVRSSVQIKDVSVAHRALVDSVLALPHGPPLQVVVGH